MKICAKCGNTANDTALFCSNCGNNSFTNETILQPITQHQNTANYQQKSANYRQNSAHNQQSSANFQQQPTINQQSFASHQQGSANYQQQPAIDQQRSANYQQNSARYQQDHTNSPQVPTTIPSDNTTFPPTREQSVTPTTQKKPKTLIWVLIVIILLLSGAAAYLIYNGINNNGDPSTTSNQDKAQKSAVQDSAIQASEHEAVSEDIEDDETFPEGALEVAEDDNADLANETESEEEEKESTYRVYKEDTTWTEAYNSAKDLNGDLICINSAEEFEKACKLAEANKMNVFWLGSKRSSNTQQWTDALWSDGTDLDFTKWLPGEPTYVDEEGTPEIYLLAFKVGEDWYFNDAPNDVTRFYSGKIGYIVEIEE